MRLMEQLYGLTIWVWYWRDEYIEVAKRVGARNLLIKAADGVDRYGSWLQWGPGSQKCIEAGITPIPWAYNYGNAAEPKVLRDAAPNSKILILDLEIEYEKLDKASQEAFNHESQALRDQGYTVGAACWARPEYHQGYNFKDLGYSIDFWMPMVVYNWWNPPDYNYWFDWWDKFQLGKTIPWLPVYKDDAGNPIDSGTLIGSIREGLKRYRGVSLWAAHLLREEQIVALEAVKGEWIEEPEPTMPDSKQLTIDAFNGIWHYLNQIDTEADEIKQALTLIRDRVVTLKTLNGVT